MNNNSNGLVTLKIKLPDNTIEEISYEAAMTVEAFIFRLKVAETINGRQDFDLLDESGRLISEDTVIHNLRGLDLLTLQPKELNKPVRTNINATRNFHQLGIFVLDGSSSMLENTKGGISKAESVNKAMKGIIQKIKLSSSVADFSFGIINFDNTASIRTPITEVADLDQNEVYDPVINHGGGTNISEGLKSAKDLANQHLSKEVLGGVPHDVVIILMSDGEDQHEAETIDIIKAIKLLGNKIKVCTAYFQSLINPSQNAVQHLKTIASSESDFIEVYDVETLRGFFKDSLANIS